MSTAVEMVGLGFLARAAISLAVYLICRKCLPTADADRYAASVAVALSFCAGYVLLPSWAALRPERHWQWLPYLAAAAMLLGPLGRAPGIHSVERWLLYALLAVAAAWLLVPTWPTLQPPREVSIPLLAGYLWLLMIALDGLPERLQGRTFLAHLTLVALVLAILLAAGISLKYGQLAGLAVAGLAACVVATWFDRTPMSATGLIPAFVVLVGGLGYVGYIDPQPPRTGMLLAPAAPLTLWVFWRGPLARIEGKSAIVAQAVAVFVPLIAAAAWVLVE